MDGEATILFGDRADRPAILLLKAVVRPPLELLPYPAIFMSAFQGEDNECRLKIVNNNEEPTATRYRQQQASTSLPRLPRLSD
jgi:hypothetical protein